MFFLYNNEGVGSLNFNDRVGLDKKTQPLSS
jgi:hypothetical protein